MVGQKEIAWGAGVIILFAAIGVFILPSEEKKVRRQFSRLTEEVSKTSNEGILDTALRLRRTEALFAPTCTVNVAELLFAGREERGVLVAQGFQARMQFASVKLSFSDIKVSFPEKGLARCEVVAKLVGTGTGGRGVEESREMEWELRRFERTWLFESIKGVEVLKK